MNPLYRLWYGAWVYWWPLWRSLYSGKVIQKKLFDFQVLKEGQQFLDFGCGTGDFTLPVAKAVGGQGKVYAVDCNRTQLKVVAKKAREAGITNIETILSDSKVDLPDESLDVVLMCDVLHEIRHKRDVLKEAYRLLKSNGVLLIHDRLKSDVCSFLRNMFRLERQDGKLLKFVK
jgi:ubiquinone/menaquinone biosynthesis C-methylase UbiE